MKLRKLRGSVCYDINVICVQSSKDDLKSLKFESWHVFSFSYIWKKDGKVFGKNTLTFWHSIAYTVSYFLHITIMTDSLSKLSTFLHKKMQKTIVKKSLKDNLQQDFGK